MSTSLARYADDSYSDVFEPNKDNPSEKSENRDCERKGLPQRKISPSLKLTLPRRRETEENSTF